MEERGKNSNYSSEVADAEGFPEIAEMYRRIAIAEKGHD